MTWDYRQNLRSVTNHLNLENGRFFISNFMWLNFQNLVARYTHLHIFINENNTFFLNL